MAPKLRSGIKAKSKGTIKKPASLKESVAIKGLAGFKAASTTFSGAVDKGVFQQYPALASRAAVLAGWDARLLAINLLTKSDRYYVLQGLEDPKVAAGNPKRCYIYQRWGHTGTGGVCRIQGPMVQQKVEEQFMRVIKNKTGHAWGKLKPGQKVEPGKYWLSALVEADQNAVWQYLVDDGIDKKSNGWYPYDSDAIEHVEELHAEHEANTGGKNPTAKRYVKSGSFTYCIDLDASTQQNTTTMKKRQIRRVSSGATTAGGTLSCDLPDFGKSPSRLTSMPSKSTIRQFTQADSQGFQRADTADTIPALWNDAQDNASAAPPLPSTKISTSSFSEFPGIPRKRQCQNQEAKVDIPKLCESGDIMKVSVAELRTWMRSRGVVASGDKESLLDRAYTLGIL
jgi:hypothetical protein